MTIHSVQTSYKVEVAAEKTADSTPSSLGAATSSYLLDAIFGTDATPSTAPSKDDILNTEDAVDVINLLCEILELAKEGSGDIPDLGNRLLAILRKDPAKMQEVLGNGLYNLAAHIAKDAGHLNYQDILNRFNAKNAGPNLIAGYLDSNKTTINYLLSHMGGPGSSGLPDFDAASQKFLGDMTMILLTLSTTATDSFSSSIADEFFGFMNASFGGDVLANLLMMNAKEHTRNAADAKSLYNRLVLSLQIAEPNAPAIVKDLISDVEKHPYQDNIDPADIAYALEQARKAANNFFGE